MNDIERRLRDLGERTAEEFPSGPVLSRRVVRRARLRKGITAFGTLGLAGLLVIGGYVGINALGGGSSQTVTGNVFDAATDAMEQQGSVRVEFDMTSQSEGTSSQDFEAHGTGEFDFTARRSYMRFEMERAPAGLGTVELITDDSVTYMKGFFGLDDKWVKTDLSSTEESGALGIDQWDATGILEGLTSASDDVEVVGQDEIAGVPVTHYRATLDPQDAIGAFDAQDVEIKDGTASVDVWIDEQELVRMMRFESSFETDQMSIDMVFDMRFVDYGGQIDIEIPDPDDLAEEGIGGFGEPGEPGVVDDLSFFVVGPDGFDGPVIIFTETEYAFQGCLEEVPVWATEGVLVNEFSGDVVAAIGPPAGPSHGEIEILCLAQDHVDDLRSSLRDHPKRYTMRLEGDDKVLTVPLMSVRPLEVIPNG